MKLVIFGLSLSSSWGNGHATVWRSLLSSLHKRGHHIVFFEADTPYYAEHRDLGNPYYADLCIYESWDSVKPQARRELDDADVGIVTSYCADAIHACDLVLGSRARLRAFYDLDTPVTLMSLRDGKPAPYIRPEGFRDFDVVFSFTGGGALSELETRLGARRAVPLYGSVDPEIYHPASRVTCYSGDLSYLGTYAADRQDSLNRLFLMAAHKLPNRRFVLGGSLYPREFPWSKNIYYIPHVPPSEHAGFYSSSPMTLNVTRGVMATMGYCPSGRLFEAAACGAVILSDRWPGIERFFKPSSEILTVEDTQDTVAAFDIEETTLAAISRRARERTLDEHTGDQRAATFERTIEQF